MSSDNGEPSERNGDERAGGQTDEHGTDSATGQAGQPAGGQPPQAASAGASQKSIGDLLQDPDTKEWVKSIAGTMAITGLGLGVFVFLMGAFGGDQLTSGGSTSMDDARYKLQLVSTVFQVAPYIGFAIASVSGVVVGFQMDATDRKRRATAAAAAFVGLVALVMIAEIIGSTQIPSSANLSLDYGQALINSVVIGVVAAIMSGGAAYFVTELEG